MMIRKNLDILFYLSFSTATLVLGIYLLRTLVFLSILLFISAIVSVILAYREYILRVNAGRNLDPQAMAASVQIRNSKSIYFVYLLLYIVLILISSFFVYLVVWESSDDKFLFSVIPILIIIYLLYNIFWKLLKINSVVIHIDEMGIKLQNKPLMLWKDIEYPRVISRNFSFKNSKHQHTTETNYLLLYFENKRVEISIEDLDITPAELNNYLKLFSDQFCTEKTQQ